MTSATHRRKPAEGGIPSRQLRSPIADIHKVVKLKPIASQSYPQCKKAMARFEVQAIFRLSARSQIVVAPNGLWLPLVAWALMLGLLWPHAAIADVYRCTNPDGSLSFSDTPCGSNAQAIQIQGSATTSGAPASVASVPTETSAIQITRAVYASLRSGHQFDVTRQLQLSCGADLNACSINCNNQIAGDPDFGTPKVCRVTYQCGDGPLQQLQLNENQRQQLNCAATSASVHRSQPPTAASTTLIATPDIARGATSASGSQRAAARVPAIVSVVPSTVPPRTFEQCRAHDVSEWMKSHMPMPDAHFVADNLNQIVRSCAKQFPSQPEYRHLDMGLTLPEQAAPCEHPTLQTEASEPNSTRIGSVAYIIAVNELDKSMFPQACTSSTPGTGLSLVWLRSHLRGGHYGDLPDAMFDELHPGDGHIVVYMTALPAPSTVHDQLDIRTRIYGQGHGPAYLIALLHYRSGKYTLLPLNYTPSDATRTDMLPRPASLSAAYDARADKYLLYFPQAIFLTPSWDATVPSWQQYYVWLLDAKTDKIQRWRLPPGPWVSDAKLHDTSRALANFSCGIDCYRQADISIDAGEIVVKISGRPSAISQDVIGIYRLRVGDTAWRRQ